MDYLVSSCFHNLLPHTKASLPIQEECILLFIIRMSQGLEEYSLLIFLIIYLALRPDLRQDHCNICNHWHLIMFSHDLAVKYHPSKALCQCSMLSTYLTKTNWKPLYTSQGEINHGWTTIWYCQMIPMFSNYKIGISILFSTII